MIGFDELAGSPKESLGEGSGSTAERRFLVASNVRLSFAESLVGTAYPNFPQSRVVAVDVQPWTEELVPSGVLVDPSVGTADYGEQPSLITAKYGPDFTYKAWPSSFAKPPFRFGTELRYQISGSAKFLTIPAAATRWEDDNTAIVPADIGSVVLIPMKQVQIQWDFVDNPPLDALDNLLGKINNGVFLSQAPETVLLEGYQVTETFRASPLDPHTNRITIQLTVRRIYDGSNVVGWNHDYREEPAGWAKLLLSNDQPRYQLANFSGMFT